MVDPAPSSSALSAVTPDPQRDEHAQPDGAWAITWRQFRKNRLAMAGVSLGLVLAGLAVFAPLVANGRPLYIRGYLTNFYDSEVAAFLDWHARLQDTTLELRAGTRVEDRSSLEARWARYRDGLPAILERLGHNLDANKRRELLVQRAEYERALLGSTPASLDLVLLEQVGREVRRRYCALSIVTAYKQVSGPLLEVPAVLDELEAARAAARDPGTRPEAGARLARLQRRCAALKEQVQAASYDLLTFLEPEDRTQLNSSLIGDLYFLQRVVAGSEHAELDSVRARMAGLEVLLDGLAARQVSPAQQRLPLVTRWPVLRYLSAIEVAFCVTYLALLTLIVGRALQLELTPRLWLLGLVGPGLVAGSAWGQLVPPAQAPSESRYKEFASRLIAQPDGVSVVVFPLVPYGENENIHADRVTAPILWERVMERDGLARRLREAGEDALTPNEAIGRLTRLRSHWLGTDDNGRDVLARLIYGSRVSLSVGFVAVGLFVLIGVLLGSLAGYFGGWIDLLLMRVTEIVSSIPDLFLIIAVMAVLRGPSIFAIMVVIGLTRWTEVMRLVRGEFLRLSALDFVTAGRALGLGHSRLIFRHMLPNAVGPVSVAATFGVAGAILLESALSFLGFGVPQPTASWGSVLNVAFQHEKEMWWVTIFAGALIFVTVTAYNLVGEGLRDAIDPRLRQ